MKNLIFTAAALAALTLASCIKSGGELPTDEISDVAIGITLPGGNTTRTVGEGLNGNNIADLTAGDVFLYYADGTIYSHLALYKDGDAPGYGDAQYTFAQITSTTDNDYVIVVSVPANVTKCMVVLNAFDDQDQKIISTGQVGNNISTIKDKVAKANAFNLDATIDHVALVAEDNIENISGSTGGPSGDQKYSRMADMSVGAIGTRVQIAKLTAGVASNGYTIESYKVAGIYINNFYPSMLLGRDAENEIQYGAAALVDNRSAEAKYGGADNQYTGDNSSLAITTGYTPESSEGIVAPASPNHWVFNLVPNGNVPHIIIKLTDIVVKNSEDATVTVDDQTRWLTIDAYGGIAEQVFEPNNMYTLADVPFTYEDMTDEPYTDNENVAVHVTVTPWAKHDVTWDKN
jgi:hypothetical protein